MGGGLPDEARRRLLELAVAASSNVVIVTDATLPDNPVVYVNPAVERVTGYGVGEVLGRNPRFLQGRFGDQPEISLLRRTVEEGREFFGVLRNQKKDGSTFWNEMYVAPVRDEGGRVTHYIGVQNDVSDRVVAEEERVRISSEYERMIRILPSVIFRWRKDENGTPRPRYIEGALAEEFGVTTQRAAGKEIGELFPAEFAITVSAAYEKAFAGETVAFPSRIGDRFFANVARPFVEEGWEEGTPADEIVGFGTEVTDQVKAEEDLRESEERFRTAFENAPIGVTLVDLENRYMKVNRAFSKMLGYAEDELVGSTSSWITHPDDVEVSQAYMKRVIEGGGSGYDLEKRYLHADGSVVWVLLNVALVRTAGGEPAYYVCQHQDLTRRKALEEELAHRAFHDPLTDLPNRALFTDRLGHALTRKERQGGEVAVLFLDLDNFKLVNDSLGHEAGDDLLVEAAGRLKRCVRPQDTVARLGGDEFAILLEGIGDEAGAVEVAERILGELAPPITVGGRELFVTPSIGIALANTGEMRPEVVRRDADVAMYKAKEAGKNRFAIFRPEMRGVPSRRLKLEGDLRRALQEPGREFRVFYQPEASLQTGRIIGVEALVRWEHPEHGLLPPAEFVPLAEETGLIVPLGKWVLDEACRQAGEWRQQFPSDPYAEPLTMSVNLSVRQFQNPGLVGEVAEALEAAGLEPDALVLEITESILMQDAPSTVATLRGLRAMGVRLAIDDFGTGYSSLSYLKSFPVNFIKIDRSIVSGLHLDRSNLAVVLSTVTLAHALGLQVVAEGVETAEEAEKLRETGCDLGQGFYWWRPGPPGSTVELLDCMI